MERYDDALDDDRCGREYLLLLSFYRKLHQFVGRTDNTSGQCEVGRYAKQVVFQQFYFRQKQQ